MQMMSEPARAIPVIDEADVCIIGGSCTGVFAAVAAARLGARVALVERDNCFGGMATTAMVCIWHGLHDTTGARQIIGGQTAETLERLRRRNAVLNASDPPSHGYALNTEELKIELDELVREAGVSPHLHTVFAAPLVEEGRLTAVAVENKSGRGAIKARCFIDASGDGDLCARLGVPHYIHAHIQPPTTCARFYGMGTLREFSLADAVRDHGAEFGLPEGFAWSSPLPGQPELTFYAGTRVAGANCADAAELTQAEMEGRRQIRAILDVIRTYANPDQQVALASLGASIGIRETRHIACRYRLTEMDILHGRHFDDTIANGTYRVDVHHDDKPGITFRYLNGSEVYLRPGYPRAHGRWRPETAENPTCYHVPFRCLVPAGAFDNLLVAGRSLDADSGAFGAVRVMVNTNQMGEAAGAAAALSLRAQCAAGDVDPALLRGTLGELGAVVV